MVTQGHGHRGVSYSKVRKIGKQSARIAVSPNCRGKARHAELLSHRRSRVGRSRGVERLERPDMASLSRRNGSCPGLSGARCKKRFCAQQSNGGVTAEGNTRRTDVQNENYLRPIDLCMRCTAQQATQIARIIIGVKENPSERRHTCRSRPAAHETRQGTRRRSRLQRCPMSWQCVCVS